MVACDSVAVRLVRQLNGRCGAQAEGEAKAHKVRVDTFPRGSKLTNELMDRVMAAVRPSPVLRQKLYQVNFHTTLSGQAMVSSWDPHANPYCVQCGLWEVPLYARIARYNLLRMRKGVNRR